MNLFDQIKNEYENELATIIANLKKQVRFQGKDDEYIKHYAMWMMARKALRSCR